MLENAKILTLPVAIVVSVTGALADDLSDRGRSLLQANCSSCHAIGIDGDSPHDEAPPFRAVMKIYGASSLEEALAEGLVTGHPDMPEFTFSAEETAAIVAFLQSLEPKT